MRTGGECPLRTLCYRQQNSHNPVFLASSGCGQNKVHLLDCSHVRNFHPAHRPHRSIDFSRSPFCPCQHPPRSAVPPRANYETPSQFISRGTNPAGREVAGTQLVAQRARSRKPPATRPPQGRESCLTATKGPQNPQAQVVTVLPHF